MKVGFCLCEILQMDRTPMLIKFRVSYMQKKAEKCWRTLFKHALDNVAKPSPIELDAPICVSIYHWLKEDGSIVIHLINDLDENGRLRGRLRCLLHRRPYRSRS